MDEGGCIGHSVHFEMRDSCGEQEMLDEAAEERKDCHGDAMRIVIHNGTVWVDYLTGRPDGGWCALTSFPACAHHASWEGLVCWER